jgi:hypothetical protein
LLFIWLRDGRGDRQLRKRDQRRRALEFAQDQAGFDDLAESHIIGNE